MICVRVEVRTGHLIDNIGNRASLTFVKLVREWRYWCIVRVGNVCHITGRKVGTYIVSVRNDVMLLGKGETCL